MASITSKREGKKDRNLRNGSRDDDKENRPPLPTRRAPSSEGSVRFMPPSKRGSLDLAFKPEDGYPPIYDSSSDDEEYRPALPTRPAPSVQDRGFSHDHHHHQQQQPPSALKYDRSKEAVMAYMIPLPRPVLDGVPQEHVPQRYMLYMPPSPDRLKIPKDKGKERKRDKAVRLWQQEVKKAKTYNGSLVSFRGMESASVRGAVWALNFVKPSDVTFLSRIPRKSIRSLNLLHPEPQQQQYGEAEGWSHGEHLSRSVTRESPEDLYDGVKEELSRSKKRTRRDFFIGTALLPVTTAIDLVIPVFGGLSEVNLVWMVLNATGWTTANKITGRLVLADSNAKEQQQHQQEEEEYSEDDIYTAEGDLHRRQVPDQQRTEETSAAAAREDFREKRKNKNDKKKIEMAFSPCPAMGAMAQYVQAACHKCDPAAFPRPTYTPSEAEVLTSIGWAPERRGREEISEEEDVAWQIRQVTEDLQTSTDRAAKSWKKWCHKHMKSSHRTAEQYQEDERGRAVSFEETPPPQMPPVPSYTNRMSIRYA